MSRILTNATTPHHPVDVHMELLDGLNANGAISDLDPSYSYWSLVPGCAARDANGVSLLGRPLCTISRWSTADTNVDMRTVCYVDADREFCFASYPTAFLVPYDRAVHEQMQLQSEAVHDAGFGGASHQRTAALIRAMGAIRSEDVTPEITANLTSAYEQLVALARERGGAVN